MPGNIVNILRYESGDAASTFIVVDSLGNIQTYVNDAAYSSIVAIGSNL
jgi:hypothetical protein